MSKCQIAPCHGLSVFFFFFKSMQLLPPCKRILLSYHNIIMYERIVFLFSFFPIFFLYRHYYILSFTCDGYFYTRSRRHETRTRIIRIIWYYYHYYYCKVSSIVLHSSLCARRVVVSCHIRANTVRTTRLLCVDVNEINE